MSDTAIFDVVTEGEEGAEQIANSSPETARRQMAERELGITEKKVLARVLRGFQRSKKDRLAREITWWLCCAFYLGDHYAEINKDSTAVLTGLETKKDTPEFRVRARNNKITPAADALVQRMVSSMTTLTATPATDDPGDIDRAHAATSVLESEWRRMGLTQSDHELRLWTVLTGTGGLWVRWNDTLGELMSLDDGSFMPSGEIEHQVVQPFHLYPDPQGTRYHNMRYMIHACEADVDMLKSAYPEIADEIAPDSLRRGGGKYWEDRLKSLMSSSLGVRYEVGYGQNTCTLLTYWEPRSREHPNGIMAICTPTAVLWMGENPWAHFNGGFEWCPIEMFRYREIGVSFWGMGAVEIAIPLQRELNRTLSQILENRNECSNPGYWVPKGCRVNMASWVNAPGERRVYTPTPVELSAQGRAYKPEREDPPPIPSALFKLIADLKAEIEDAFAYHQVSKGGAPPGVRSGVAIENLQETDQAPSVPIVQRHNVCWARVGKRLLQLAHDHWDFQRMINVGGDDGHEHSQAFLGSDLPPYFDVVVDSDILLPQTRLAKLDMLIKFVEVGLLLPAEAKEAIFEGEGSIRAATRRASLDQRKQARENRRMGRGQPAEIANYDNHMVHLKVLNDFRKTATFERIKDQALVVADPQGRPQGIQATIGELFEIHAFAHAQALLQQGPEALMGMPGMMGMVDEGEGEPENAPADASRSDATESAS